MQEEKRRIALARRTLWLVQALRPFYSSFKTRWTRESLSALPPALSPSPSSSSPPHSGVPGATSSHRLPGGVRAAQWLARHHVSGFELSGRSCILVRARSRADKDGAVIARAAWGDVQRRGQKQDMKTDRGRSAGRRPSSTTTRTARPSLSPSRPYPTRPPRPSVSQSARTTKPAPRLHPLLPLRRTARRVAQA